MKIATFGCSWTHGQQKISNFYSWPQALSERNPNWKIDNYAISGTSLQFSIWLYNKIMNSNLNYDAVIFQITSSSRLTYYKSNGKEEFLEKNLKLYSDNYSRFDVKGLDDDVQAVTVAHAVLADENAPYWKTDENKYEFAKLYYEKMNPSILAQEYKMFIEYIQRNVNLCFFHHETPFNYSTDLPLIKSESGDNWNNFVADDGDHFNKEGCQWQAQWVEQKLKENRTL